MPPNSVQNFSNEESPLMQAELLHLHDGDGKQSCHIKEGCADDQIQENLVIMWLRRYRVSVVLVVSVLLGLMSGSLYGYGRYAKDLKEALSLNQFEMERLGILLDTGNYLGHPVTGYIFDQCGPVLACILGGAIVFASYGFIHVGVVLQPLWMENSRLLDAGFFMVGFGTGLGYIAALASTTKNFQSTKHLSVAISVVASAYALCSTLVGISYGLLGLGRFFIFWAILILVVNSVGAFCYGMDQENDHHLCSGKCGCPIAVKNGPTTDASFKNDTSRPMQQDITFGESESKSLKYSKDFDLVEDDLDRMAIDMKIEDQGLDRWVAFRTSDFWILFAAFACCTGCGLFIINNVSIMVQSIGGQDTFAGQLVVILSFANCFGRICIGVLADRYDKLLLLGISSLVMAGALFVSACEGSSFAALLMTVVLVAAGYGGSWVLAVGILSDWFGSTNFGKNYGVLAMGPALSGMLFNTCSAWMYEKSMKPNALFCLGASCYKGGFLLTGSAALCCTVLVCVLGYKRDRSPLQTQSIDKR